MDRALFRSGQSTDMYTNELLTCMSRRSSTCLGGILRWSRWPRICRRNRRLTGCRSRYRGWVFRCCGTRSRSKIASSGTCSTRRNTRLERERKENRGNRNNRNNREKSREISKLDGVKYYGRGVHFLPPLIHSLSLGVQAAGAPGRGMHAEGRH